MKTISKKDPLFESSVIKQRYFINQLKLPKDDIERSYNQYLCQKQGISKFKHIFINICSFFLYFYFLYFKKNDSILENKKVNAIFISDKKKLPNIPIKLIEEFSNLEQVDMEGFYLTNADKDFIKEIRNKYRYSFLFLAKIVIKIGIYRKRIEEKFPKAIIVTSEYSFTSSVLTRFCKKNGIEHINIMHGEKVLFIRDSWFHFNRCYVWDQYFINLFNKNKAFCDHYFIELPPTQEKWEISGVRKEIDFTYYLQNQTKKELLKIYDILSDLKEQNYIIAIRPHPLYSDMKVINSIFRKFCIENTDTIDIKNSILRTNAVISLFSTVNRQAFLNGVDYIIDDISNQKKYKQMQDLQYYFVNKKHKVISSYIMTK